MSRGRFLILNLQMEALVMRRMTSGKRKWAHENPERFFGENSLLTLLAKLEKKDSPMVYCLAESHLG